MRGAEGVAIAGEEGDGAVQLPVGWECVTVPPPAKSYLLSPGVDSEGKVIKRVRLYNPYQLATLQVSSATHPNGRFQELTREHFPWVKQKQTPYKRIQV